jgi:hypothetical protein
MPVGYTDLPARAEQIDVRLVDRQGVNDNLDLALLDTVCLVEQLRRERPHSADPLRARPAGSPPGA